MFGQREIEGEREIDTVKTVLFSSNEDSHGLKNGRFNLFVYLILFLIFRYDFWVFDWWENKMEEQEKNAKSMDSPNVPSLTSPVVVTEPFFSLLGS